MTTLQELIALGKKALEEYLKKQSGGEQTNTKPEDVGTPLITNKFYGLMLTDVLCDPELEKREVGLLKLRTKYNTILSLIDLQKNGSKPTRPYVEWARERDSLNSLGEKNIKYLKSLGFKLIVIGLNSWGGKHGFTQQMGSTQESVSGEAGLYTSKQLSREMQFYSDLISKVGNDVDGIMPLLEAIQPQAANFGTEIAKHIRSLGYKGEIWFNHLSEARKNLNQGVLSSLGVKMASSINSLDAWNASSDPIRNSDGMTSLTSSNTSLISSLTSKPGKDGFILWSPDLIGNTGGRPSYSDNWIKFAKHSSQKDTVVDSGSKPVDEDPKPVEIPGESPPERHKRLYPNIPLTGGDNTVGNKNTLWKPQADVNKKPVGNLVVVVAYDFPKINYVSIEKGGAVIEKKPLGSVYSAANGCRLNFRFSKKGGSYGTGLTLRISTVEGDWTGSISNGGSRVDPVNMKRVSSTKPPEEVVVKPADPVEVPEKPATPPVQTSPNVWFKAESNRIWLHPKLNATVERVVMCYNLGTNPQYENAKYSGNNTYTFSKLLSQYPHGVNKSVIGIAIKSKIPELKDVVRSNNTYQINYIKNDWDYAHVTPHDPIPLPNNSNDVDNTENIENSSNNTWKYGNNTWLYQHSSGKLEINPKLAVWLNPAPRGVQWIYKIERWAWPHFQAESTKKVDNYVYTTNKPLNQYPYGAIKWRSWRLELDKNKAAEYHRVYASLGLPKFKHVNDNGTRNVDVNYTGPVNLEIM